MQVYEQCKDPFQQVSSEGNLDLMKEIIRLQQDPAAPWVPGAGQRGGSGVAPNPGIGHLPGDGDSCSVLA